MIELGRLGHWVDLEKLNEDSVIIDAGACTGEFIEEIRKHVNCKIIAIEPDPESFMKLREKNFDNVELHNNALVGERESAFSTFYAYPQKELGNMFELYPGSTNKFTVRNIKLSELPKADYLKLDIEGCEKSLFEDDINVAQLCAEIHSNSDIKKIKIRLEEQGYSCEIMPRSELYATKISLCN